MKLHVNRTCFQAGLKSQTGMSSFCLSCERTLRELQHTFNEIMILRCIYSDRLWIERAEFSLKLHNKVFVQTFRCAVALWKF